MEACKFVTLSVTSFWLTTWPFWGNCCCKLKIVIMSCLTPLQEWQRNSNTDNKKNGFQMLMEEGQRRKGKILVNNIHFWCCQLFSEGQESRKAGAFSARNPSPWESVIFCHLCQHPTDGPRGSDEANLTDLPAGMPGQKYRVRQWWWWTGQKPRFSAAAAQGLVKNSVVFWRQFITEIEWLLHTGVGMSSCCTGDINCVYTRRMPQGLKRLAVNDLPVYIPWCRSCSGSSNEQSCLNLPLCRSCYKLTVAVPHFLGLLFKEACNKGPYLTYLDTVLAMVVQFIFLCYQIVSIGLCSVVDLIRETQLTHPMLCGRALQSLLDILQGQQPEGLRTEPAEVVGQCHVA